MKRAVIHPCFALALVACTHGPVDTSSTTTTAAIVTPDDHGVATFLDDDPAFTRRVEARIASDPALSENARNVEVTTRGQSVTLAGTVPDYATLDALRSTLEEVRGISRVYLDVQVWPLADADRGASDETIAFSLQRSLVEQPRVTIDVVRGVVTLRGQPSESRDVVENIATRTPGVRTVVDELAEPPSSTTLVQ
jgi:osmotically-inducible protein OsmY